MGRKLFTFILLVYLSQNTTGKRKTRNNGSLEAFRGTLHPNNCSRTSIGVRLQSLVEDKLEDNQEFSNVHSSIRGLLEIIIPHMKDTTYLCFPRDYEEYRQTYIFSHVACRQMGYMTFIAMNEKSRPAYQNQKYSVGLRSYNFNCTGQEQTVSHCSWSEISTTKCQFIAEIACGGCESTLKGLNGVVKSPGFPFAYLYDITCEWNIMVPRRQTILIIISPFGEQSEVVAKDLCELDKPYVEIMYGIQHAVTVLRFCNLSETQNVNIPFNTVKIRIFSGFYSKPIFIDRKREQGITIAYEAIGIDREYIVPLKLISLTLFGIIFVGLLVSCRYIQKYKLCHFVKTKERNLQTENLQSVYDLGKTPEEFENCYTQKTLEEKPGLRLRSNDIERKAPLTFLSSTPVPTNCKPDKRKCMTDYFKYPFQDETPKAIPEIVLHSCDNDKRSIFQKVKANLLNRYSNKGDRNSSNKLSVSSLVFSPEVSSLQQHNSAFESGDEIDTKVDCQGKQP